MSTAVPEVRTRRRPRLPRSAPAPPWMTVVVLLVAVGALAPELVGLLGLPGPEARDPAALNLFSQPTGPSSDHLLGVDPRGRDVFSRMLFGLRSLVGTGAGAAAAAWLSLALLRRLERAVPDGRAAGAVISALALVLDALEAFPPLLLGLGLGVEVGPGPGRLVLVLAVVLLPRARGSGPARLLGDAMALDVGLTFLGLSSGGGPQLGAMIAHAGAGILAGIPAWWALLFPAVPVLVLLLGLARRGDRAVPAPASERWTPVRVLVVPGLVGLLGWLLLPALGSGDRGGSLMGIGPALAPSGWLVLGGLAVWGGLVALGLWGLARARRPPGRWTGRLRAAATTLLAAVAQAPPGWLGYVALFLFADSVGQIALLPAVGADPGPGAGVGHWVSSLAVPWLVLGVGAAAGSLGVLARAVPRVRDGAQQQVARAAGVAERTLARQRRRALLAVLVTDVPHRLGDVLGAVVLVEVVFGIPGLGGLLIREIGQGREHGAGDLILAAGLLAALAGVALEPLRRRLDPAGALR